MDKMFHSTIPFHHSIPWNIPLIQYHQRFCCNMQDRYDKAGPGTVVKILQTSVLCFSHQTPRGGRMVGSRGGSRKKKEGGLRLLGAHEILTQVQGRNLHILSLPLGC